MTFTWLYINGERKRERLPQMHQKQERSRAIHKNLLSKMMSVHKDGKSFSITVEPPYPRWIRSKTVSG